MGKRQLRQNVFGDLIGSIHPKILDLSTNKGDLIFDCFAGSGTTGAVAEKLERRWIMCDCGKLAIYTMQKRLMNLKEEIGNKGKDLKLKPFVLYNAGLYNDKERNSPVF